MWGAPGSVVPVFGTIQPLEVIPPHTAEWLAHLQESEAWCGGVRGVDPKSCTRLCFCCARSFTSRRSTLQRDVGVISYLSCT